MKIVFFGSSDYCLPVLETISRHFRLEAIITRPDKPFGRKQILTSSLPKIFAQKNSLPVFTPESKVRLLGLKEEISQIQPDLVIVSDYGLIIPKEIFAIPRYKTLNIHFSKLPKFRGPSPVQYTILYGEKSAWISIFIMDEGMDTGDIIWQKEVILKGTETTEILYKKLFNITAIELPDIIKKYTNNQLKPIKQDHSKATYTKRFTRKDGFLPAKLLELAIKGTAPPRNQLNQWLMAKSLSSQLPITNYQLPIFIERAIRAFTPWPGAWTEVTLRHLGDLPAQTGWPTSRRDSPRRRHSLGRRTAEVEGAETKLTKRLKILKAHLEKDKLVFDLVQLEGKKPVSWKQFQQGYLDFSF